MLKDLPNAFVGLGGTLQVLLSTNLLADILSLDMVSFWLAEQE